MKFDRIDVISPLILIYIYGNSLETYELWTYHATLDILQEPTAFPESFRGKRSPLRQDPSSTSGHPRASGTRSLVEVCGHRAFPA